jgi:Flp pilus assembly protein TadD
MATRAAAICLLLAGAGCAPLAGGPDAAQSLDLRLADATLAAGAPGTALHVTDSMLQRDPRDFAALLRRGRALVALGRCADAAQTFDQAAALRPASLEAVTGRARARAGEGDPAAAEQDWRRALALAPADARVQTGLAVALDLQERHAQAQALYRLVLARMPDDQAARSDLGLSLVLSGQVSEGLPMLREAAEGDGETALSARARHNFAVGLVLAGDESAARAVLSQDMPPASVAAALTGLRQFAAAL